MLYTTLKGPKIFYHFKQCVVSLLLKLQKTQLTHWNTVQKTVNMSGLRLLSFKSPSCKNGL